jgi:hypothetical protein
MSYSPPAPNSYPQQPGYGPPTVARTSGKAVFSLIAGIASWFFCPGLASVLAVITGYMAKSEIRNGGGFVTGDGLATVGLVLGYLNIAVSLIGICVSILFLTGAIAAPAVCIPFMNNIEGWQ